MRVGYPRALLYYHCFPFWKGFLEHFGHQVCVSGQTTKKLLESGIEKTVGEACLPVKIFFGHALALKDSVDAVFLPRLVSLEQKTYICPKFMGLPSMIRASLPELPPLIEVEVDARKDGLRGSNGLWRAACDAAVQLGDGSARQTKAAFHAGQSMQKEYEQMLLAGLDPNQAIASLDCRDSWDNRERDRQRSSGRRNGGKAEGRGTGESGLSNNMPKPNILLLGHPYNVHDGGFNLGLKTRLSGMHFRVTTMESVPARNALYEADKLSKAIFWSLGRRMVGTAMHLFAAEQVAGVMHLAAFGCGPDSMIGEVVEREARRLSIPFISLVLDEHTGEAGFLTRVEAFGEMLTRRGRL
ncbi:MAG TPA: hypothetical protein DCX37_10980 [Firmicutes bacterium]|jgi:predicted nucleotide-binding protein (sugar kinase/HSP70/actin superfamily)|nr:hypothetical protein [Bacillota bacterium]